MSHTDLKNACLKLSSEELDYFVDVFTGDTYTSALENKDNICKAMATIITKYSYFQLFKFLLENPENASEKKINSVFDVLIKISKQFNTLHYYSMNSDKESLLIYALQHGKPVSILNKILNMYLIHFNPPSKIDFTDKLKMNVLMYAFKYLRKYSQRETDDLIDFIDRLTDTFIKNKADFKSRDISDYTVLNHALHYYIKIDDSFTEANHINDTYNDVILKLLKNFDNVDTLSDVDKTSALIQILNIDFDKNGNSRKLVKVTNYIIDNTKNINHLYQGKTAIMVALNNYTLPVEVLDKLMLKNPNINIGMNENYMTPIFYALKPHVSLPVFTKILGQIANINSKDITNTTPLMYSLLWEPINSMKVLLILDRPDCNVNIINDMRKSALDYAIENKADKSIIERLKKMSKVDF